MERGKGWRGERDGEGGKGFIRKTHGFRGQTTVGA